MALVGNMIHDATHGNPSPVNYEMFLAVFSMLSLFYLIPATVMDSLMHPIAMIVLDALNCLFFFAGGVTLAVKLRTHSCSNQVCFSSTREDERGMLTGYYAGVPQV